MNRNIKNKNMKELSVFFALIVITLSLHAQTDQTYTEAFDSIFINVSRVQATTGILYERVVPFADLQHSGNISHLHCLSNIIVTYS